MQALLTQSEVKIGKVQHQQTTVSRDKTKGYSTKTGNGKSRQQTITKHKNTVQDKKHKQGKNRQKTRQGK